MTLRGLLARAGTALLVGFALLAVSGPFIVGPAGLSLLYLILYYVCLTAAWNLFSGFSGYINFGFVVFSGIGMYATMISLADARVGLPLGYLGGGLAAAAFAALIGYPVLRTRGAYFSIAMLAIAEGTRVLFGTEYLEPLTRGGKGLAVKTGGLEGKYAAMLLLTIAVFLVTLALAKSRVGLALISIREDETAADALGVNTTSVKVFAFVLSAFFAGVAGGIHATFLHYIDPPAAFDIKYTTMPIIMAIFGGLGTVLGPVIGGVILEVINDLTWLHLGRLNVTIFGTILVCLVLWLPDGMVVSLKEAGLLPKTRTV